VGVVGDARFGGVDLTPWGKFDRGAGVAYPLLFHLLDTAAVAGVVWDRFVAGGQRRLVAAGCGVSVAEARRLVMFVAGLHDLGKLSAFQKVEAPAWARVSEVLRGDTGGWRRMPHERASMHAVLGLLAEAGYRADTSDSAGVRVAQIVGGHHGRFLQLDLDGAARSGRVDTVLGGPGWRELRRRYFALVRHLTGAAVVPARVSVPAAVLITGVGVVADRLASQRHYWLPRALAPAFGAGEHYARAVRDAPGLLEESGLARISLPAAPFARVHGPVVEPNALQASLMTGLAAAVGERGAGIVVVTDATGGGKTIAALEAARIFNAGGQTAGICWLLPTMAAADAAYDVLEGYVAAHRLGHAPVSLVHSHSWLNSAYTDRRLASGEPSTCDAFWPADADADADVDVEAGVGVEAGGGGVGGEGVVGRPGERVTVPDGWLRGWDRALLAQFTVATVDQALMAALPVRFGMLRLLALSGRTVIVDEVHALSPFMRQLLGRLLAWLGALGCPVVLLSATLPRRTSNELVRSYLAGAGHSRAALAGRDFTPGYPGWLFAAAADACPVRIDAAAAAAHAGRLRRTAQIRLHPVRHDTHPDPGGTPAREYRLQRITAEIAPVVAGGGCAAVVCATVADAQRTYQHLRRVLAWPGGPGGGLVLLHARLPGHQREEVMRRIRGCLGRTGERPARLVVVSTGLLDMSLDIDVDVMVSDLAPVHTLLQRLGRLWRFEPLWDGPVAGRRPAWLQTRGRPRLEVLQPVDEEGRTLLPAAWRTLDAPFLPHATAAHLAGRPEGTLTLDVPDDVQRLVEAVHGDAEDLARTTPGLEPRYRTHQSRQRLEEHRSALHLIPAPRHTLSLADLHRQHLHARDAATRLGVMPRRVLPVYRTPAGQPALDAAGTRPLVVEREPTPGQIRSILRHTLPVPAAWVAGLGRAHHAPAAWHKHALLADLVLLEHPTDRPDEQVRADRHTLRLDPVLGLVHTSE
jgi:CRISPR-associated endonuclease/helicase Cas3